MKIEIIKIDKDGYNLAQINDNENYLNYMYNPEQRQWKGLTGKINNVSIRNDFAGWQKNGKGRLAKNIIEVQQKLSEYFYSNIDDIRG
jgi:archaeosine-15-forming tRNA-guanine transglycosylase